MFVIFIIFNYRVIFFAKNSKL